jgi:hypothetical protein
VHLLDDTIHEIRDYAFNTAASRPPPDPSANGAT